METYKVKITCENCGQMITHSCYIGQRVEFTIRCPKCGCDTHTKIREFAQVEGK